METIGNKDLNSQQTGQPGEKSSKIMGDNGHDEMSLAMNHKDHKAIGESDKNRGWDSWDSSAQKGLKGS